MNSVFNNENGATLIELIVAIILMGAALPALLVVIGQMSDYHMRDDIAFHAVSLANNKMEEIYAFKNEYTNWSGNISSFAGTENLTNGYTRTVTITTVYDWISTGIDACKIEVVVSHPTFTSGYVLTTMFVL